MLSIEEIKVKFDAKYVGPSYKKHRVVSNSSESFVINEDGDITTNGQFRYISEPCEGFRRACLFNWKWVYLNIDGTTAFNGAVFDTVTNFDHGLAMVGVKENPGDFREVFSYIDKKGYNPFSKYSSVGKFHHGLAVAIDQKGQSLYIERSGFPLATNKTFMAAWPFEGNLAKVMLTDGSLAFMDNRGHLLT